MALCDEEIRASDTLKEAVVGTQGSSNAMDGGTVMEFRNGVLILSFLLLEYAGESDSPGSSNRYSRPDRFA